MADVGRWMEEMRMDLEGGLDREELAACAECYGRPAVRWLLRLASKKGWIDR